MRIAQNNSRASDRWPDTPIGKQSFRIKGYEANRAQLQMEKDPRSPFAVMSPPTYIDPTPFMD